jgi:hypothetical protein
LISLLRGKNLFSSWKITAPRRHLGLHGRRGFGEAGQSLPCRLQIGVVLAQRILQHSHLRIAGLVGQIGDFFRHRGALRHRARLLVHHCHAAQRNADGCQKNADDEGEAAENPLSDR